MTPNDHTYPRPETLGHPFKPRAQGRMDTYVWDPEPTAPAAAPAAGGEGGDGGAAGSGGGPWVGGAVGGAAGGRLSGGGMQPSMSGGTLPSMSGVPDGPGLLDSALHSSGGLGLS